MILHHMNRPYFHSRREISAQQNGPLGSNCCLTHVYLSATHFFCLNRVKYKETSQRRRRTSARGTAAIFKFKTSRKLARFHENSTRVMQSWAKPLGGSSLRIKNMQCESLRWSRGIAEEFWGVQEKALINLTIL